jgi:hypothetical protein
MRTPAHTSGTEAHGAAQRHAGDTEAQREAHGAARRSGTPIGTLVRGGIARGAPGRRSSTEGAAAPIGVLVRGGIARTW